MARIAFLLPNMAGGGAERVALTLMAAFIKRGHEIDLLLMEASGQLIDLVPSEVRIIDLKARRTRNLLFPLIRYLHAHKPDALQARMWPITVVAIVARLISRSSTRIVVSDHGCLSIHYASRPITLRVLGASVRIFYPFAAARISVTAGIADDLADLSGLNRNAWQIIHNPLFPPDEPTGPTPEAKRTWRGTGPRILAVGSLLRVKNHALLLRAFAGVVARRPAQLLILGEGPLRRELEELATNLGIDDRLSMPGFVASPWPFYASADLVVISSNSEGYVNVIIEALDAGVPVVSTDCPTGPREILDGGRFGKLVPIGNPEALARAMLETLEEPIPTGLQQRARELSGDQVFDEYLDVLLPRSS